MNAKRRPRRVSPRRRKSGESDKVEVAVKLLRWAYLAEHRNIDALSGRLANYRLPEKDEPFRELLATCRRCGYNPFHVIRTAFGGCQVGDMAPTPNRLFRSSYGAIYNELSVGWETTLAEGLLFEWKAAKFSLEETAEVLNCELSQAAQIEFEAGHLPVVFGYALFDTLQLEIPKGRFYEAVRVYSLSPQANAKAAATVGLKIPKVLTKYGPIIKWVSEVIAR